MPEWDEKFVETSEEELFELLQGASYLDIRSLLNLCCAKVASLINSTQSIQEVRELFDIKNDFTPEEEAQIREENKWCEEK